MTSLKSVAPRFTKRLAVLLGTLAFCATASANVTYRWVESDGIVGYRTQMQFEITLSDANAYSGSVISCNTQGLGLFCPGQPDSDLINFTYDGVGRMNYSPRTGRPGFAGWDMDITGSDEYLTGSIFVFSVETDIRMSSNGNLWTIHKLGSDQPAYIPDEYVTGTFQRVPEPATLALFGAALAGLGVARRRRMP